MEVAGNFHKFPQIFTLLLWRLSKIFFRLFRFVFTSRYLKILWIHNISNELANATNPDKKRAELSAKISRESF